MRIFFLWCPGKIELEPAFPKSTLNFHGINSWTILSLASHPIRNCWENLLSSVEICEGFMADSSFDSSISRRSSDVVDFFFLLSSFEVLIAEKKKQTSLSFDNSKSHSSRFSQIQFQACWISSSLTLQTHLNATTEHVFSIAATMWHSTLSLITLLFSCEQGLLILTSQRSRVKALFQGLLAMLYLAQYLRE